MWQRLAAWLSIPSTLAYTQPSRLTRSDYLLAAVLGLVALAISVFAFNSIDPRIYEDPAGFNVWFEADAPRALGAMENRDPKFHVRNEVHPIFSIATIPVVVALKGLGLTGMQAAGALVAAAGFGSAALVFMTLRGIGLPQSAATLFSAAFVVSAAYLHWFALAESYSLACLSVCAALFVLVRVRSTTTAAWILTSAATLGVTVSNWMVSLVAVLVRLVLRRAIAVSAAALVLVTGLAILAQITIPGSSFFLQPSSLAGEVHHTQIKKGNWSPIENLWGVIVSGAVVPAPFQDMHSGPGQSMVAIVDNQRWGFDGYGLPGLVGIAAWLAMIGTGIAGGIAARGHRAVFVATVAFLGGQLALHLVYGNLTFLYAANFFPAAILLAAFSWHTTFRIFALGATAVFILAAGISNLQHFQAAAAIANSILAGTS